MIPRPGLSPMKSSVRSVSDRFSSLLRRSGDPGRIAIGHWTVGDVAAHVAHSMELYVAGAAGGGFPQESIAAVDTYNATYLRMDRERDLKALAVKLEHQTAEFLGVMGDEDRIVPWLGGAPMPLTTLAAVMLSELLVHGYDIARAGHVRWDLDRTDAALSIEGLLPTLPLSVDPEVAAGVHIAFEVRVRGGPRAVLSFEEGALEILRPRERRRDCVISADPGAFMLVAYGRIGQWAPVLSGKIVAWEIGRAHV